MESLGLSKEEMGVIGAATSFIGVLPMFIAGTDSFLEERGNIKMGRIQNKEQTRKCIKLYYKSYGFRWGLGAFP